MRKHKYATTEQRKGKNAKQLSLPGQENKKSANSLWAEITMEYTARSLTEPLDVLRALAAVASEFQPVFGSVYLAGLWSSSIKEWLMWYRKRRPADWDPDQPKENFQYRRTIYVAPSWSWASIREPIQYWLHSPDSPLDTESPRLQVCSYDIHLSEKNSPFADIS